MRTDRIERFHQTRSRRELPNTFGRRGLHRHFHVAGGWNETQRVGRIDDQLVGQIDCTQGRLGRRPRQRNQHPIGTGYSVSDRGSRSARPASRHQSLHVGTLRFARTVDHRVTERCEARPKRRAHPSGAKHGHTLTRRARGLRNAGDSVQRNDSGSHDNGGDQSRQHRMPPSSSRGRRSHQPILMPPSRSMQRPVKKSFSAMKIAACAISLTSPRRRRGTCEVSFSSISGRIEARISVRV